MNKQTSSTSGKKAISVALVVLVVLGFSYFLYKISPEQVASNSSGEFDISNIQQVAEPRAVEAGDYVLGEPQAKNTFIVYEDFQCPACATFASVVEQVPSQFKDTKVIFRHFPLSIHPKAPAAAYAAEAAGAQGKFWQMYDNLYGTQAEWSNLEDTSLFFKDLAGKSGVADLDKFMNDMLAKNGKDKIQADMREAFGLGVGGTPTVYFNGKKLELSGIEQLKSQAEKLYK